jgi:hypothetical protein
VVCDKFSVVGCEWAREVSRKSRPTSNFLPIIIRDYFDY